MHCTTEQPLSIAIGCSLFVIFSTPNTENPGGLYPLTPLKYSAFWALFCECPFLYVDISTPKLNSYPGCYSDTLLKKTSYESPLLRISLV